MFGVVKIGDREIEMVANAATAYRFGQVFHEDLLVYFTDGFKTKSKSFDIAQKLGYIMAKAAEKADMKKLNEDTYISWLEELDQFDLIDASNDILAIYLGNEKTLSTPKKKAGQQREG